MNSVLKELGIEKVNYGACSGAGKWSTSQNGGLIESVNLIAAQLIVTMDKGPQEVKRTAQNFGITTPIYAGEALSLGASSAH